MRPDLSDPAQRRAYIEELRSVYRLPRTFAVGLVAVGGLGLVAARALAAPGPTIEKLCWAVIGAGAAACLILIILRTRYHRQRTRR